MTSSPSGEKKIDQLPEGDRGSQALRNRVIFYIRDSSRNKYLEDFLVDGANCFYNYPRSPNAITDCRRARTQTSSSSREACAWTNCTTNAALPHSTTSLAPRPHASLP